MSMDERQFDDLKQRIRDAVDIVELVTEHVPSFRRGKGLCPFHEERTASFTASTKHQTFKCFGCGKSGDIFTWVMEMEGLSFWEALNELARRAGVDVPVGMTAPAAGSSTKQVDQPILEAAAAFYRAKLQGTPLEYLVARGYTPEFLALHRVGYAAGGLRQHLSQMGTDMDRAVALGLLTERNDGSLIDFFYERIIFPVTVRGKVVSLVGRVLGDGEPKYLNLRGEINFLYNEDALSGKVAYLAEGITDTLTLAQLGLATAGSIGAGGMKPSFARKFSRCEKVYISFDGDNAGRQGALKAARIVGEKALIVPMPDDVDASDYIAKNGKDKFLELASSALDLVRYELSLIPKDIDKPELPARLAPILEYLATLDVAKAETYLRHDIKTRFELRGPEIEAYRKAMRGLRVEAAEAQESNEPLPVEPSARFAGLVDIVEHEGKPAFLIKEGAGVAIKTLVEVAGKRLCPPDREQLPWMLANAPDVVGHFDKFSKAPLDEAKSLFDDIVTHLKAASELPANAHYSLLAAWVLHTYLHEQFQYSPILSFFALPERGKSRTGKSLIYLAYRGVHVESVREAFIVRMAEHLSASLFIDVKNLRKKAEKQGSEDMLLGRFERGIKVPRVLAPDKGPFRDTTYFSIFGPTIVATNV